MQAAKRKTYHRWLVDLTSLPTAAGREDRVVAYIRQWASSRRSVSLTADTFGNLTLRRKGLRKSAKTPAPIYIEAHMDHPAFVVQRVLSGKSLLAVFRGGVKPEYFAGTPILLHHGKDKPVKGKVINFEKVDPNTDPMIDDGASLLRIEFKQEVKASVGDVITWDVGRTRIADGKLYASACDDLAGVAAALAAYDQWLESPTSADLRLLFTRSEEIGFIGAIAACKAGTIPKDARLICLENSKSFTESPIGGGPIVRVGDATSTFDSDLTFRCSRLALSASQQDATFRYQRKLMAGGTCEASAFQAYGYIATCLCLPLGNYHNMNERTGKIDSEIISMDDFDGLVKLLGIIVDNLDDPKASPALLSRLEELFEKRKHVLDE